MLLLVSISEVRSFAVPTPWNSGAKPFADSWSHKGNYVFCLPLCGGVNFVRVIFFLRFQREAKLGPPVVPFSPLFRGRVPLLKQITETSSGTLIPFLSEKPSQSGSFPKNPVDSRPSSLVFAK